MYVRTTKRRTHELTVGQLGLNRYMDVNLHLKTR